MLQPHFFKRKKKKLGLEFAKKLGGSLISLVGSVRRARKKLRVEGDTRTMFSASTKPKKGKIPTVQDTFKDRKVSISRCNSNSAAHNFLLQKFVSIWQCQKSRFNGHDDVIMLVTPMRQTMVCVMAANTCYILCTDLSTSGQPI